MLSACTRFDAVVDVNGSTHNLENEPVVLMWLAPDCPLCQTYSTEFVLMADSFPGLRFFGVLPGDLYSSAEVDHFVDSFHFRMPILLDSDFKLTKKLDVTTTPEFLILDNGLNLKYQGKFDDWATGLAQKKPKPSEHYLEDALKAFSAGKPIETAYTEPLGCLIEFD